MSTSLVYKIHLGPKCKTEPIETTVKQSMLWEHNPTNGTRAGRHRNAPGQGVRTSPTEEVESTDFATVHDLGAADLTTPGLSSASLKAEVPSQDSPSDTTTYLLLYNLPHGGFILHLPPGWQGWV